MNESVVYFSIGSNLGDRYSNISKCISLIEKKIGNVISISSLYKNLAQGFVGDYFYNCCIKVKSSNNPLKILNFISSIESEMGRENRNSEEYQSRIIDIDIILFDDLIFEDQNLKIPHPRFHERNFVLLPLLEINNELIDPKSKVKIKSYLMKIKSDDSIEKISFNYLKA